MMDFYNKYLCRAMMCMLLVTCSMLAYAQSTPTITVSPVEMIGGFKDGSTIYCILTDTTKTVEYNVSVPEGYSITQAEWNLYLDDILIGKYEETDVNFSFNIEAPGIYTLKGNITVNWKDGDKDVSEEFAVESMTEVEFLEEPEFEVEGSNKIVSYHNRPIDFAFITDAKKGEWEFRGWTAEPIGTKTPTDLGDFRFQATYENKGDKDIKFQLIALFEYEYKNHVFVKRETEFDITVSPELKLTYSTPEEFSTAKNETFNLGVKATHGEAGQVVYEWKKGEEKISGSSEKNEVTVSPSSSAFDARYSVVVSYIYEGETFDSKDLDFVIHVFPTPEIIPNRTETLHILDKQSFEFVVEHNGGYDNESAWSYEWTKFIDSTKEEVSLSTMTNKHKQNFDPEEESGEFHYKVRVINKHNGTTLADSTLSFHVMIYATPEVTPKPYNDIVVGNRQFTLKVDIKGGDPKGWSYNWTRKIGDTELSSENGSSINGSSISKDFMESNETQDFVEYTYILHYINTFTLADTVWIEDSCEFNVKVYPNVKIEYTKEPTGKEISLYQKSIELGAKYSGGYDGSDRQWDFRWIHNNKDLGHTESEYTHKAKNPTAPSETDNYTLLAQLFKDDQLLYDDTLEYKVVSYRLQEVTPETKQTIHTSGGKEFRFAINAKYAYPGGWTYQWKRDDVVLDSETDDELRQVEDNKNISDSIKHVYEVIAYNHCDGKLWDSDTLTFEAVVWPEITLPEHEEYDRKLREGDYIILSATDGKGGYTEGWEYEWLKDGAVIHNQNQNKLDKYTSIKKYSADHNKKEKRTEVYTLHYRNIHKLSNTVLEEGTIQYEVIIHRCPMEPFELVRKGNGTSNIYIADMRSSNQGFNDATLAELEYNFCFGYGDNNEINREDATKRYYQYTKEQANQKPWVYTYWEYDGYVCKSEKVHYGQSRGTTSISDINEDSLIDINSKGFKAVVPHAMPAILRIISYNGEVVETLQYDSATEFDETFDLKGLERGLYIVEICIGENRKVNKIIIN